MNQAIRKEIERIKNSVEPSLGNNPAFETELLEAFKLIAKRQGIDFQSMSYIPSNIVVDVLNNGQDVIITSEFHNSHLVIERYRNNRAIIQKRIRVRDEDFLIADTSEGVVLPSEDQKYGSILSTGHSAKYYSEKGWLMSDSHFFDHYPLTNRMHDVNVRAQVLSDLHRPNLGYYEYLSLPKFVNNANYINTSRDFGNLSEGKKVMITNIKANGSYSNRSEQVVPAKIEEEENIRQM